MKKLMLSMAVVLFAACQDPQQEEYAKINSVFPDKLMVCMKMPEVNTRVEEDKFYVVPEKNHGYGYFFHFETNGSFISMDSTKF